LFFLPGSLLSTFFFPTTLDTILLGNSYLPLQPTYRPSSYLPHSDHFSFVLALPSIANASDSLGPRLGFRALSLQSLRGVRRKKTRSLECACGRSLECACGRSFICDDFKERQEKQSYKVSSLPFYVFFSLCVLQDLLFTWASRATTMTS
jgi:hypothetical protein